MGNSNKKQCIVFIDDRKDANECQAKCLNEYILKLMSNDDSGDSRLENFVGNCDCTVFRKYNIDEDRNLDIILLQVCLCTEAADNAKKENEEKMERLREKLVEIKNDYATVLPVVDMCLAEGSRKLDKAWDQKDFIFFFKKLHDFPIKLLVSAKAWAFGQDDFNSLKIENTLFTPRPLENESEGKIEFDMSESCRSTIEDAFFSEILLKYKKEKAMEYEKFSAAANIKKIILKLIQARTRYDKFFYTILVANEILYYFK